MTLLEQIISARPSFHEAETEVQRSFDPSESLLHESAARRLATAGPTCYGIEEEVLHFIADHVDQNSKTLETGAGCSTLVFAVSGAQHTAVTPSEAEVGRIREYAQANGIGLDTVKFAAQPSEMYLPRCDETDLDLVLLDGKHAFPWPMVDWFFTADRLKRGGLMLIDDAHMRSVALLGEFLSADTGWQPVRELSGKTLAFHKTCDKALDVAWHMQRWTIASHASIFQRVRRRLGKMLRGS